MSLKTSKYAYVKDSIKKDILDGKYETGNGRLPTCRELVKTFDVSYLTANNAMRALQEEGFAKMIQGKGIFAQKPIKRKHAENSRTVALVGPLKCNIFKNLLSALSAPFESAGLMPVPSASTAELEKLNQWEVEEIFNRISSRDFNAFVAYGCRNFPFKTLQKYYDRIAQTIFAVQFDSSLDFPNANYVLSNFYKAGVLAGDHLIKTGRAPIALLTFECQDSDQLNQFGSLLANYDAEIADGLRAALVKHELPENSLKLILESTPEASIAEIKKLITGGTKSFVALGDRRTAYVYRAIHELNLQVGKDVAVIGACNSDWAEVFTPGLTRLSMREDKIAEAILKVIQKKWTGKKIKIEQTLIARDSA